MSSESVSREERLQHILAGYLQDIENGKNPDREILLTQHPDLADDLRSFLVENDKMRRFAYEAATVGQDESTDVVAVGTMVRYFGDYELLEEIARGGMGIVYKARQVSLNRIVALKMILRGELATPADVQRFDREAKAAANLDHPNIIPIYEVGEHEGEHFFSMKFVEGGSLAQQMASGKWPVTSRKAQVAVARLVATTARAVHHAHQRGILHRDLKPGNLLLDVQGEPHVTDFGLAKRVASSGEGDLTRTGAILGTPSYMPPEQAHGDKGLSTAVDVYSLGAILYELLAGRPPFRGENPMQTLLQILEQEPPLPANVSRQAKIDRDLQTICMKCLEKNPKQRYLSADALADDLERWLRGEPIAARPVRLRERLWRWCRRNPALAVTTTLAMLALVAALSIGIVAVVRDRENSRLERDRDRERLWTSFIEQARAERLAGNRERSLRAIRQAADIRRDDELRFEAIATITRPGLRLIGELDGIGVGRWDWLDLNPKISSDGKLAALWLPKRASDAHERGFNVLEIPSGKLMHREFGRDVPPKKIMPLAFRPGTTQMAIFSLEQGGVMLWDYTRDQELGLFGESAWIKGIANNRQPGAKLKLATFSTDGSHLLTVIEKDNILTIRVWNLADKREAKAPGRGEFQGFFSGNELLLLDQGRYLKWNCATGKEQWLTPAGMQAVSFTTTAQRAAVFGRLKDDPKEALHIWDLDTGKRIGAIPGLGELPGRVDFSPNGRYMIFDDPADAGRSMGVWDLYLERFTNRLTAPRGLPLSQERRSFNPDGSLLAGTVNGAGETDTTKKLCIWDTAGTILATLPDSGFEWSQDGERLITYGGYRIRCWEVTRPVPSYELGKAITLMSLNRDGDRLAVNQWVCAVLKGAGGVELASWEANQQGLVPQFVGKDERWGVQPIQRFDWVNGRQARPRPDRPLFAAGVIGLLGTPSAAGPRLAYATCFPRPFEAFPQRVHDTELWQLAPSLRKLDFPNADYSEQVKLVEDSGKPKVVFQFNSVRTSGWALSPAAPLLVRQANVEIYAVCQPWKQAEGVAWPASVLELWNYQEGKRLAARKVDDFNDATLFQFSPDGRRIAMFRQANLEIWDTATFRKERELLIERRSGKLTFSPDGRHLLVMNGDQEGASSRASLFDVDTGREVQFWKFKARELQAFAVSPDMQLAATGGDDKMLRLWDVASGKELARWPGHDDGVTALLFSKDGETLYSGSQDGALKLWHLPLVRQELKALNLDW